MSADGVVSVSGTERGHDTRPGETRNTSLPTAWIRICVCAHATPQNWPHVQPLGSFTCRCGGWKAFPDVSR